MVVAVIMPAINSRGTAKYHNGSDAIEKCSTFFSSRCPLIHLSRGQNAQLKYDKIVDILKM